MASGVRADQPPPEDLAVILDKASAHYAQGRVETARALYGRAERQAPGDVRAPYSLAVIDLRAGRFVQARQRLRAVLRRAPDLFAGQHNLGVAEQALGDWGPAAAAYARALALRPEAKETAFNLAIALAVIGRGEEAVEHYRALARHPECRDRALTRLAILRPGAIDDDDLAHMRTAATRADPETRIGLLFALGGALDVRGEADKAFDAYAAGNALKRASLAAGPPDSRPDQVARAHAQSVARVQALFTSGFLSAHAGRGDTGHAPIFIVGLPRSGSSLVEQILASHPLVAAMGESAALTEAVEGRFPYPPDAAAEPDHFRRLARRYLDAQRQRGWRGRLRPADKTLENLLHVGLVHLMFPRARILRVTRDPIDAGFACFRQLFARGNETLYDLTDIAQEIRRQEALMAHWRAVLPGRVTEVRYETLVTNPDREIRALITQACGLPWSDACLRFHETQRPVATASADQVRRPVFATSVNRWLPYAARLDPLLRGLKAVGDVSPADS
jgi:hypothetical protein